MAKLKRTCMPSLANRRRRHIGKVQFEFALSYQLFDRPLRTLTCRVLPDSSSGSSIPPSQSRQRRRQSIRLQHRNYVPRFSIVWGVPSVRPTDRPPTAVSSPPSPSSSSIPRDRRNARRAPFVSRRFHRVVPALNLVCLSPTGKTLAAAAIADWFFTRRSHGYETMRRRRSWKRYVCQGFFADVSAFLPHPTHHRFLMSRQ